MCCEAHYYEMIKNVENEIRYQFNADPTNLMACCDNNCRSMLWTLVQLSSYYAKEDGWFYRSNDDLRAQTRLSENLVRATLSTFYKIGIIDVRTVGQGKSKTPNEFKLNVERFNDWEKYSLEDCIKHPDLLIETDNYKASGWRASYLEKLEMTTENNPVEVTKSLPTPLPTPLQSEDNINIIENKDNILFEGSKHVEVKSNQFDEYKKREDYLMDKLYNVSTWTDFKTFRKQINELISTAASDKIAEKAKKRYKSIEEGKVKFLKSKISKEPYNSFYDDFYKEYGCVWLGKDSKQNVVQPQPKREEEEDPNADLRATFEMYGWEIPDELKPKPKKQEYEAFSPIDEDNLPF